MRAGRDGHALPNGDLIDGNTLTEYFLQYPRFGLNDNPEISHWGNCGPFFNHPLATKEEFAERMQMVLNGFRMLTLGGPRLSKLEGTTKVTAGENVVADEVYTVRVERLILLMSLAVMFIVEAGLKTRSWWHLSRGIRLE